MKTGSAPWIDGELPGAITLRSGDGAVTVSIQWTSGGVFVQRCLRRRGAAHVIQAARFGSAQAFHRWCEADAVRFDDPLLSARLVRHGDDLFRASDAANSAN